MRGNSVWLCIQCDEGNLGANLIKWVLNDVSVWFQFMVVPFPSLNIFSCVYYSMASFYCQNYSCMLRKTKRIFLLIYKSLHFITSSLEKREGDGGRGRTSSCRPAWRQGAVKWPSHSRWATDRNFYNPWAMWQARFSRLCQHCSGEVPNVFLVPFTCGHRTMWMSQRDARTQRDHLSIPCRKHHAPALP